MIIVVGLGLVVLGALLGHGWAVGKFALDHALHIDGHQCTQCRLDLEAAHGAGPTKPA